MLGNGEFGSDLLNLDYYCSGLSELGFGWNWKLYVRVIDDYGLFDLIFIDGWVCLLCIKYVILYVKFEGWLVVDNIGDWLWWFGFECMLIVKDVFGMNV